MGGLPAQRFEAIMYCHGVNDDQISAYCQENGFYQLHLNARKNEFISGDQHSESIFRQEQKKLKQENKRLKKELHRKEKALSELLVRHEALIHQRLKEPSGK